MKKLVFMLAMLLTAITASADTDYYKAFQYAVKVEANGVWSDWTDWYNCDIIIAVSEERLVIYSKETQIYYIQYSEDEYTDDDGGYNAPFISKDAEGKRCGVRLRRERNGNCQLYIEYNDARWVYNIKSY